MSYDSDYGGVKQQWLLIRSEQAYKREQHNLNKRMLKAGESARESFKQLCQQRFACAKDAQSAVTKWQDKQAVNANVIEVPVYQGAGRPKLGQLLKSPDFLTSAIYLKKPERIEALLMVMTCCLMVYAGLEHQIRKTLVEKGCYFPDMKYKPAQRPTARWVFQCFEDITIMY